MSETSVASSDVRKGPTLMAKTAQRKKKTTEVVIYKSRDVVGSRFIQERSWTVEPAGASVHDVLLVECFFRTVWQIIGYSCAGP